MGCSMERDACDDSKSSPHPPPSSSIAMDTSNFLQIIDDHRGHPVFVVIPYASYAVQLGVDRNLVPDVVSRKVLVDGITPVRAWREYFGHTQKVVAARLGISQQGYAQLENNEALRRSSIEKLATALGIAPDQIASLDRLGA
ncbi:helix-turn-helix transcriptional regulator [Cupriavidus metallidurans]|jgi:DNA-binding XRE family transcriptional regulator|uniref:XRE family transcriptional regulator n=3 Tax=Burkholderiaceae TaxID=119060 RepID=A0A482IZI2_9BURK|nr:XRE family transcriptional regulator [Cupriavidus metallidurans]QWC91629.1 helix-turn-helix transcriptional regulator [Cupriavidus metallidurans]